MTGLAPCQNFAHIDSIKNEIVTPGYRCLVGFLDLNFGKKTPKTPMTAKKSNYVWVAMYNTVEVSSQLKDCKQYLSASRALPHFYPPFYWLLYPELRHFHVALHWTVWMCHQYSSGWWHPGSWLALTCWHGAQTSGLETVHFFWLKWWSYAIRELAQFCMSSSPAVCNQFLVH